MVHGRFTPQKTENNKDSNHNNSKSSKKKIKMTALPLFENSEIQFSVTTDAVTQNSEFTTSIGSMCMIFFS